MTDALRNKLASVVAPLLRRPRPLQVAALCYRGDGAKRRVLLITSRDSGRWIVPKGWLIDGLDAPDAALQEAWEEAGVRKARVDRSPVGTYGYAKRLAGGVPVPVEVQVYAMEVRSLVGDYPEAHQRKRKWVSPEQAAEMVQEPGLKAILRQM